MNRYEKMFIGSLLNIKGYKLNNKNYVFSNKSFMTDKTRKVREVLLLCGVFPWLINLVGFSEFIVEFALSFPIAMIRIGY